MACDCWTAYTLAAVAAAASYCATVLALCTAAAFRALWPRVVGASRARAAAVWLGALAELIDAYAPRRDDARAPLFDNTRAPLCDDARAPRCDDDDPHHHQDDADASCHHDAPHRREDDASDEDRCSRWLAWAASAACARGPVLLEALGHVLGATHAAGRRRRRPRSRAAAQRARGGDGEAWRPRTEHGYARLRRTPPRAASVR